LKTVVKLAVLARSYYQASAFSETLRGMVRSMRRMYIKESGLLPSILHSSVGRLVWERAFGECYTWSRPLQQMLFNQARFVMFFRQLLVASFLLIFAATAASAYTIVMRNGRTVEIPNTFMLTSSTLTYETAPGIQVTIQLTGIDVAATERINGQTAGSFMASGAKLETPAPVVQTRRAPPTKSITNKDLEVYRRARLESEREREELGLPSLEQRQREVAEIDDRIQDQIRDMRSREELDFWRNRAMTLETQITATQNQMRVNQVGDQWAYPYGIGIVTSGFPFGFDGFQGSHRFNRFGFNNFGFNPRFPGHFRGRLLFSFPRSGGGSRHGGGGHRGGRR
jgi:hypothetical protein